MGGDESGGAHDGRGPAATFDVAVHTSGIASVAARIDDGEVIELERDQFTGDWVGRVPTGSRYTVVVDGHRPALDPRATEVWFPPGHSRRANRGDAPPDQRIDAVDFPRAVAAPWPSPRPPRHTERPLVVYEAHVRGLTRC